MQWLQPVRHQHAATGFAHDNLRAQANPAAQDGRSVWLRASAAKPSPAAARKLLACCSAPPISNNPRLRCRACVNQVIKQKRTVGEYAQCDILHCSRQALSVMSRTRDQRQALILETQTAHPLRLHGCPQKRQTSKKELSEFVVRTGCMSPFQLSFAGVKREDVRKQILCTAGRAYNVKFLPRDSSYPLVYDVSLGSRQ